MYALFECIYQTPRVGWDMKLSFKISNFKRGAKNECQMSGSKRNYYTF